jgi:HisA/HisF family protein
MTRVIPVLDILNQKVVRATGGRRNEYRPIRSQLTSSCDPLEVARVLLDDTQSDSLYIADLDAITTRCLSRWAEPFARAFPQTRIRLDSGIRTASDWSATHKWVSPVLGTETLEGPEVIRELREREVPFTISLDLRDGELLGAWQAWQPLGVRDAFDTLNFASLLARDWTHSLMLLDLDYVGEARGPSPRLCEIIRNLKWEYPLLEILTGGGVRDERDLEQYQKLGVDGVLVSTALHTGALRGTGRPSD